MHGFFFFRSIILLTLFWTQHSGFGQFKVWSDGLSTSEYNIVQVALVPLMTHVLHNPGPFCCSLQLNHRVDLHVKFGIAAYSLLQTRNLARSTPYLRPGGTFSLQSPTSHAASQQSIAIKGELYDWRRNLLSNITTQKARARCCPSLNTVMDCRQFKLRTGSVSFTMEMCKATAAGAAVVVVR